MPLMQHTEDNVGC